MTTSNYIVTSQAKELDALIRADPKRHLLIVGPGGIGKTAFLEFEEAALRAEGHIVVNIKLREVASPSQVVERAMRAASQQVPPDLRSEIGNLALRLEKERYSDEEWLLVYLAELIVSVVNPSKTFIVMLDGFDEAPTINFASFVVSLARKAGSHFKLVVTSRSSELAEGFLGLPNVDIFEMGALTDQEATALLAHTTGRLLHERMMRQLVAQSAGIPGALLLLGHIVRTTGEVLPQATSQDLAASFQELIVKSISASQVEAGGEEAVLLLKLLAVFYRASIPLLAAASGLSSHRVQLLLTNLTAVGLTTGTPQVAVLTHSVVREAVVATYLLPAGFKIGNLGFGAEAAEHDTLLESTFLVRPDLERVVCGEKTIVLGDRGAGKSAFFARIQGMAAQERSRSLIVTTSPHPANILQTLTVGETQISSPEKYKALWLLYIAALAAKTLYGRFDSREAVQRRYRHEAKTILRRFGWSTESNSAGWLLRAIEWLRSAVTTQVKFSVGPITIEPSAATSGAGTGGRRRFQVYDFLELTDSVLETEKSHLLIVVDQIDEIYKYERVIQEAVVQGLLLAEAFLSQKHNIGLTLFLRTDLFELYDIQEKNKFVSRLVRLAWSRRDLLVLLVKRLCANQQLGELGEMMGRAATAGGAAIEAALRAIFPEEVEETPFVEWFFYGLSNANDRVSPRQVILFLNLARDSAASRVPGDGRRSIVPLLNERNVRDAMTRLSELSYEEVLSDFRVATGFVRSCRAGNIRDFNLQEVQPLFDLKEGSVAEQIERLERLGFLGRSVLRRDNELVSRFSIPPLFTRCWKEVVVPA
jgi:hypothetical protein